MNVYAIIVAFEWILTDQFLFIALNCLNIDTHQM